MSFSLVIVSDTQKAAMLEKKGRRRNKDTCANEIFCVEGKHYVLAYDVRRVICYEKSNVKILLFGDIHNKSDLIEIMNLPNCSSIGDLFYSSFKANRLDSLLENIDGKFCGLVIDKLSGGVDLYTDRNGLQPIYWYESANEFICANTVFSVCQAEPSVLTLDHVSVDCFLELGYLVGSKTYFKEIKVIKPAYIISYKPNDEISYRYYWSFKNISCIQLGFDDCVDALHSYFSKAIVRRFDPSKQIGISLSGGLDSRAILAAVNDLFPGYEGFAYTFGEAGCPDVEIAKQSVNLTKWSHREFHFNKSNWLDERLSAILRSDGMIDVKHLHGVEFEAEVKRKIEVNLNGYAGDVVLGGGWIKNPYSSRRGTKKDLKKYYGSFTEYVDYHDEYYDFKNVEPALYTSRIRRFTNCGLLASTPDIKQFTPFFDNNLIEWAMKVPQKYRYKNHVYSVMLLRYYPNFFKKIPWQKTGKPAAKLGILENTILSRVMKKLIKIGKGSGNQMEFINYNNLIANLDLNSQIQELKAGLMQNTGNSIFEELVYILDQKASAKPVEFQRNILRYFTLLYYFNVFMNERLSVDFKNYHEIC